MTTINLIKIPVVETFEVQLAANQEAFAEQMMQMMKLSLTAQNTRLSPRAEQIYDAQLKKDGETMCTSRKLEKIEEANLTKRKEERISTAGKSKLEINSEMVSKADDEKRNSLFAAKAKKLEDQVNLEKLEKLQRTREIPFEI